MAYPAESIGRALFIMVILFILYNLWATVYAGSGGRPISGFSLKALLWYLVLSEAVVANSMSRKVAKAIEDRVKSGEIAYMLSRPYSLLGYMFASVMAPSVALTSLSFAFGAALMWALAGPPAGVGVAHLPLVALSVLLGLALQFMLYFIIGLSALWVEDISAFRWMNEKLAFVAGGVLVPLSFYPAYIRAITDALPYGYISFVPAYLFANFSMGFFLGAAAAQAAWIAGLAVLGTAMYRLLIRKVSINGG